MSAGAAGAALRSWLFVPGDSERKQARALSGHADVLILDLEDSVAAAGLPAARTRVAALIGAPPPALQAQLWVRVNSSGSGLMHEDLAGACAHGMPAGIVLPKVSDVREIVEAAAHLATLEAERQRPAGATRLLVLATETAQGVLALPRYPRQLRRSPAAYARLAGLTWGAEDLGSDLGVLARRHADGSLTAPFQHARTLCLLVAAALGVPAIDTVYTDFRDGAGLAHELGAARRDGFGGKLAIHPDQVAAINSAFAPTAEERAQAERVVAAFAAAGNTGVASLDGRMLDRPHLLHARRILGLPPEP